MPLGLKTCKLGAFGSNIPTYCSKPWLERNVFQSQNLHPWNTECKKSGALEGRLIFRRSLAWDEVLQLACCCFELKVTGFHLALVFMASLSEEEDGVKPCQICKSFWSIQTKCKLIKFCCLEDFKVFIGNWTLVNFVKEINPCRTRSFSDGSILELCLPAGIFIPNNGRHHTQCLLFSGHLLAVREIS